MGLGLVLTGCKDNDDDEEVDKGCRTVTLFEDIKVTASGEKLEMCETCLNTEVKIPDNCDGYADYAAAKTDYDGTDATKKLQASKCILEAWRECSAQIPTDATNCDGEFAATSAVDGTGADGILDVQTLIAATSLDCQICITVGSYEDVDSPTCVELVDNIQLCDHDLEKSIVDSYRCPDCSGTKAFDSSDALCKACLDSQIEDGEWSAPAADASAAAYSTAWNAFATCGSATSQTDCTQITLDSGSGIEYTDAPNVAQNAKVVEQLDAWTAAQNNNEQCSNCVYSRIASAHGGVRNCFTYEEAMTYCANAQAPNDLTCEEDVCKATNTVVLASDANCNICLDAHSPDDNFDFVAVPFTDADWTTKHAKWDPYTADCNGAVVPNDAVCSSLVLTDSEAQYDTSNSGSVAAGNKYIFDAIGGTETLCGVCVHVALASTDVTTVTCSALSTAINACADSTITFTCP